MIPSVDMHVYAVHWTHTCMRSLYMLYCMYAKLSVVFRTIARIFFGCLLPPNLFVSFWTGLGLGQSSCSTYEMLV